MHSSYSFAICCAQYVWILTPVTDYTFCVKEVHYVWKITELTHSVVDFCGICLIFWKIYVGDKKFTRRDKYHIWCPSSVTNHLNRAHFDWVIIKDSSLLWQVAINNGINIKPREHQNFSILVVRKVFESWNGLCSHLLLCWYMQLKVYPPPFYKR